MRRLESELASAQAKLKVAEQQLKELPSESERRFPIGVILSRSSVCPVVNLYAPSPGAMRVQLSEALAAQQKLRIDRDVALQRCKIADERSNRLESQLRELKILHSK